MGWKQVQALRKEGKIAEGKKVAYELLEADDSDYRTRTQLEWLIFAEAKPNFQRAIAAVKEKKRPQHADLRRIDQALTEFTRIRPERPGWACSAFLDQVARVGEEYPRFAAFAKWVGIEGLCQQDWQVQQSDTGTWPPLVVTVARALTKWVKSRDPSVDRLEQALQWADASLTVADGDDRLWLQWDRAGILRRLERYDEAARALSAVIKAKRNEFWVWAEAGRLYAPEDPDLALACFCQALLCSSSPEFVAKAHRELAELLAERGDYAQASREIRIASSIREDQGWRLGPELEVLMREPWYDVDAAGAVEPRSYYLEYAPAALMLCFDEVETRPATFLGVLNLPPPKDAKPGWKPRPRTRFAVLSEGGKSTSLLGPHLRKVPWKSGDAVSLILGKQAGQSAETIVQVVRRSDGEAWDCTVPGQGVVSREASGCHSMRVFAGRELGELPTDRDSQPGATLQPGDGVRFRMTTNPKNNRVDVFAIEPGPAPEQDVKRVHGTLLRAEGKGHGFVDDVFVPPPVVKDVPDDVEVVSGIAVYAPHPKKGHSWRAITLSPTG